MIKKLILILFFISFEILAQDKFNMDSQFREFYPKALAGEANAMFNLGKIYIEGTSSAGKDFAKGFNYIQKASSVGNVTAMKYLVEIFEHNDPSGAFDICLRLQKLGENYCDTKMEILIEKSIPKSTNLSLCKKISDLYANGYKSEYLHAELANCVLLGFSKNISNEEALSFLRSKATTDTKFFLRLMNYVLKVGSQDWDPLFVEENLPKVGLKFMDRQVKDIFLKNGITFDGCRKMDLLRKETLRQRPSVCRMAAKSGDEEAALYVGEAYLGGKDYFTEDSSEATLYIKDVLNSKNPHRSTQAFILLLDVYNKQGKFYDHFSLVAKEIKRNSSNSRAALASFGFEANYLQRNHSSMSLEDIQAIIDIAESYDVSQSVKSLVGRSVDDIIKDRGNLIRKVEKDSLLYYRKRLMTQQDLDEVENEKRKAEAINSTDVMNITDRQSPTKAQSPMQEKKDSSLLERIFK
jgi:TPR repeat protein